MSDALLLKKGIDRLEWADKHMNILQSVRKKLIDDGLLDGLKISMALHTEAKTGMLALTLQEAGAKVRLASCNPLSTDDSVALALNEEYGLETFAKKGETNEEYYSHLNSVLDISPDLIIDDGMDLISLVHTERSDLLANIIGANEETTTGIVRLKAMEADNALKFPAMDVNDAMMKHLFDNRYGTGQSTFDGLMTATNLMVAGKNFVVGGYGWCGRGIAMRAQGFGARVYVSEIDPVKAVEARMDGFDVQPMAELAPKADFIVTVTGCKDVVDHRVIDKLKDGVLMANAGHFNNEISIPDLEAYSTEVVQAREFVNEYRLKNGRKVNLIADGRLVNLAVGQGHPVEIMDMSFAIQALCATHLVENKGKLEPKVYQVPAEVDDLVARKAMDTLGIGIDVLTKEQIEYSGSWKEGT